MNYTRVHVNKGDEMIGPLSIRQSGNIGQEILDADGRIICWTTDSWVARVIRKLLNENEGLLGADPSVKTGD